jgi:hypothetical protein
LRGDIALFLALVGVITAAIVVGVLIFVDGGSSNPCDKPLVPLGGGEANISQEGFDAEDAGLTEVIQAAEAGNIAAVEANFFGEVHNFTHNVDPVIREEDEDLAKELCAVVISLEEELAFDRRLERVAADAREARDLLRDGAELLGYDRPGQ